MGQRVKVFSEKNVAKIEGQINEFISENDGIYVLSMVTTESVRDFEIWTTVWLLYEPMGD